jgi:type II secretory pathway pseudopilin PulG
MTSFARGSFLPAYKKRFITRQRGFTLIVTVSLMVLLMVLALAMLSLSSVSLRSSSASVDRGRAMANARTALMMAIGELQRQVGPDTRVTARADILNEVADDYPPLLGAWRSWQGENHEQTGTFAGRPVNPGNYPQAKRDRFLAWLVSGAPNEVTQPTTPPNLAAATGKIPLIGPGTVGNGRPSQEVHLPPVPFLSQGQRGAYAWWIGGENQKARLPEIRPPAEQTVAAWSARRKSTSTADPAVFRLDALLQNPDLAQRLITMNQTSLSATTGTGGLRSSQEFFHDLSPYSVGLLTNTATGGWRKDFSLATENWSALGTGNLPFFQVSPGNPISYSSPTTSNTRPDRALFYPWSAYRGSPGTLPIYEHGAVASWANLQNWATLYKTMSRSTAVVRMSPSSASIAPTAPDQRFNFHHRVRILPVTARVQWVFSWSAADPPATNPPAPSGSLQPRLLVTPVITLWNPYNVTLSSPTLQFNFYHTLPNAFRFRIGPQQNTRFYSLNQGTTYPPLVNTVTPSMQLNLPPQATILPGESRVFSPEPATPVPVGTALTMRPGLNMQGGFSYPILDDQGQQPTLPGATSLGADVVFDAAYSDVGAIGVGVYLDMNQMDDPEPDKRHLVYRMVYDQNVARQTYPPINNLASASLSQVRTTPQPFLTTIFGARTASRTHLAAKGFVQTSPLVNYTAMGGKDTIESTIMHDYPGTAHPVNSPFDYSFAALSGAGDSLFPNTDSTNRGFIVTGFTAADGLSRSILCELPTRPVQSLGELQHWDLRYENPIPPYAFNLIGNSDASPLIPSDQVIRSENYAQGQRDLQHDDSYCANHLLFDDWFVSSITPQTTLLGRPLSAETLRKTYEEFVAGTAPLANTAYRPIPQDAALAKTTGGAATLFTRHVSPTNSWRTIASRLEVDGMFNVNSTSVSAWRALLGHARGQRIPFHNSSSAATLSSAQDFAFSRFAVAADTDQRTRGNSGLFSTCSEYAGYRLLDAPTLDRFAQEIVNQVRRRGPFLSLAEFVNRQLSSGELALAGTIQAALNALAAGTSNNPFSVLQNGSRPSTATPPSAAAASYAFPAAANGFNAYGIAGWTRQADVLRPLAPILSARDDTFVIRAYGDARDSTGTRIIARATCEAVVRRTREFVDQADAADILTLPQSPINQRFGRRFTIISFRWLSPQEI